MSCCITNGIALDCRDNTGGIEYVYIGCPDFTETFTEAGGTISSYYGLTASGWYKFETPKQVSSFTETINTSEENGTVFYDQQLTIIFTKWDREKRNQIALLAKNRKLAIVVKDGNGNFWSIGARRGAHMLSGSAATGTAYGDRNGFEIILQGLEKDPSYSVDKTIVGE